MLLTLKNGYEYTASSSRNRTSKVIWDTSFLTKPSCTYREGQKHCYATGLRATRSSGLHRSAQRNGAAEINAQKRANTTYAAVASANRATYGFVP